MKTLNDRQVFDSSRSLPTNLQQQLTWDGSTGNILGNRVPGASTLSSSFPCTIFVYFLALLLINLSELLHVFVHGMGRRAGLTAGSTVMEKSGSLSFLFVLVGFTLILFSQQRFYVLIDKLILEACLDAVLVEG